MATLQFSQGGESPPKSIHRTKQLLNHIVDGTAVTRPSAIYAEVPRSFDSYEPGYRRVTYRALANAINGIAWWLHQKLGPGQDHQTIAYVGPNDLTYVIMILGAVKAGYKASLEGQSECRRQAYEMFYEDASDLSAEYRPRSHPSFRRNPMSGDSRSNQSTVTSGASNLGSIHTPGSGQSKP